MELYVFDKDINVLGIIENWDSLRWLESYNNIGEFEMVVSATSSNLSMLWEDNILWKTDSKSAMVIEKVNIKDNQISIRGRDTKKYITERIVLKQLNITNVEQGLRKMIQENCIDRNPIKYLQLGASKGYEDKTDSQFTYDYLDKVINAFNFMGYKIDLDIVNKKHILNFYKGQDLSDTIVFAEEFDNITDINIDLENKDFKNYAIVGGQGEGVQRKIVIVDLRKQGEEIRELWVDAKDISNKKTLEDNSEVEMSDAEYTELLKSRGIEKLSQAIKKSSFTATLETTNSFIYGKDYNIGDLVTCKSSRYGIKLKVRVTDIQMIYDSEGVKIITTFGQ